MNFLSIFVIEVTQKLLVIAPYLVAGITLELALSRRVEMEWRARWLNITIAVLYWAADVLASATLAVAITMTLAHAPGRGLLAPFAPRPSSIIGTCGMALGWILLIDFFYYWMHRAQHTWQWFWAEHAVHHSDPHMNVTTTYRHHWLEKPIEAVVVIAPMAYLMTPAPAVAAVAAAAQTLIGHFIHMDARIGFGRWNWLLANPQHHRIHHSIERQHFDVNFAAVWPVWDVIFGTYYRPRCEEYPRTGVVDYPRITNAWDASLAPFRAWIRSGIRSSVPTNQDEAPRTNELSV